jgi:phosphate transport system permease protein
LRDLHFHRHLIIIAIVVVMFTVIVIGGKDQISWEFLTSFPEDGMTKGGIFPAIYGTALLVILMSIAAVPFGTVTAIYLTEYAK